MPFGQFLTIGWVQIAAVVYLFLAVLTLRMAKSERRRVVRTSAFYVLSILSYIAHLIGDAFGLTVFSKYTLETSIVISGICLILIIGSFIFEVGLARFKIEPPAIVQDLIVAISLIAFGLFVLGRNGVDTASIFTTSAILTAVVALSLQDTLGNLLGGLALQIDQSIQVGDWIQIDNISGHVVEIGWRQTSIETNNWETMVVPNSVLVKNRFLVLGRRTGQPVQHRRFVPFFVDNQYSPEQIIDTVQDSLRAMDLPWVAKTPVPQCFLLDLAENPIRYTVSYWLTNLESPNPTDSSIRAQVYLSLKRAGIPIASPTRNIYMTEETSEKRKLKWEQELAQRVAALRSVDIFAGFTADELYRLAERLQPAPYIKGDILVRQGAEAMRLYIIVEGYADVFVENEYHERARVAGLGPGTFFGEMGLMTGERRTATVIAKTNMSTYRLDKESFRSLLVSRQDVAEQISHLLAERRSELAATRENLDAEALAERTAAHRHAIRQKIWHFFGLED